MDVVPPDVIRWGIFPRLDTLSRRFLGMVSSWLREISRDSKSLKVARRQDMPYKYLAMRIASSRDLVDLSIPEVFGQKSFSKADIQLAYAKLGQHVAIDRHVTRQIREPDLALIQKCNTLSLKHGHSGIIGRPGEDIPVDYVTVLARVGRVDSHIIVDVHSRARLGIGSGLTGAMTRLFIADVDEALRAWLRNPKWDWQKIAGHLSGSLFSDSVLALGFIPGSTARPNCYAGGSVRGSSVNPRIRLAFRPAMIRGNYEFIKQWATSALPGLDCLKDIPDPGAASDIAVQVLLSHWPGSLSRKDLVCLTGYLSETAVRENIQVLGMILGKSSTRKKSSWAATAKLNIRPDLSVTLRNLTYASEDSEVPVDYEALLAIYGPECVSVVAADYPEDLRWVLWGVFVVASDAARCIDGVELRRVISGIHPEIIREAVNQVIREAANKVRGPLRDFYSWFLV